MELEDVASLSSSTSSSSVQSVIHHRDLSENILHPEEQEMPEKPFRRWVSTLRRRKEQTQPTPPPVTPRNRRWTLDDFDSAAPSTSRARHMRSNSWTSSIGFVAGVKSATITLASASVAPLSRRASKWKRSHNRSSIASNADPRPSTDTHRSVSDEASRLRSRKRREKLEELIRTEESYVADLKSLSNAYFTFLNHQEPSSSLRFARPSAQKTITDMLNLHDDLLGTLYSIVPFAEYDQQLARAPRIISSRKTSHVRWHSVDVVPVQDGLISPRRGSLATAVRQKRRSLNLSRSEEGESVVLRCAPQVVAAVTKKFQEHMARFQVYEDYGANYELVVADIEEMQHSMGAWSDFDRAIETLSATVNPTRTREENRKKALTVKDLLIKVSFGQLSSMACADAQKQPIQRLPRYELLFNDLSKLTPVCDDLEAHSLIQDLLTQLNLTCQNMNLAKDDPAKTTMLRATWLVGDRLTFSNQISRLVFLQLLGSVKLCGCLHIAYRSRDFIKGTYVACVLFESTLLLAVVDEETGKYSVLVGIALTSATLQEADNGKGLQCHTAPHSWKIVFEHAARMYEFILTACSAVEAQVWREQIAAQVEMQSQAAAASASHPLELHSPLVREMRSIGKAFGKPGSFVRRMSVHRTATVGPTTDLNQVIIKNTLAVKEVQDNCSASSSSTSLQIPRSQSVVTPSHVQTLAPRRAERIRLEVLLADVWTKHLLPYPGMTVRRSEQIRGSANNVMRKFSMASIASNFSSSKRSASYSSIAGGSVVGMRGKEDLPPMPPPPPHLYQVPGATSSNRSKHASMRPPPARLPLADLLPADFDLQDQHPQRSKRSAFRALTMTMERPFSPLMSTENRNETMTGSGLRRAHSVRDSAIFNSEDTVTEQTVQTNEHPTVVEKVAEAEPELAEAPHQPRKSKSRLLRFLGH